MRYEPHNYQQYVIQYIIDHPIAAVFLDMGLGKTSITLTAIQELLFEYFDAHKILMRLRSGSIWIILFIPLQLELKKNVFRL